MHKHKVIRALKTFSPEEFKKFEKFIKSPYFNTSKDTVKLFALIKKHYPAFENPSIEMSNTAKKFNPKGKATTEARIRNILTELNALVKRFLSIEYYVLNEPLMRSGEIKMFYEKSLFNEYQKESKSYLEKYGNINNFWEDHIHETYKVSSLRLMDVMNQGAPKKDVSALTNSSFLIALLALNGMITYKRLAFFTKNTYNLEFPNISGEMFDCFDIEKFLEIAKKVSPKIYDLTTGEFLLLKMILNKDFDESYQKIKKLLFDMVDKKHSSYNTIFTLNCINTVMFNAMDNEPYERIQQTAEKSIPLMDFYLKKKLYKKIYTHLPIINFCGFLNNAAIARRHDWMKEFIENYTVELSNEDKEFGVNFGWGSYHNSTGCYNDALSYYSKISQASPVFLITVRYNMMQCHYELQNYETALSLAEAHLIYFERNYKGVKDRVIKQTKLFIKLIKITSGSSLSKLDELEAEINKSPPFVKYNLVKYLEKLKR